MNTSYDMNSTPKTIDQSKYIESLMDFSTPMSNISNSRLIKIDSNRLIVDKLLRKFHEHKTNFNHTQTYLNLLDNHLRELTTILQQLHNSLDQHSSLKSTTDQLEIRLLQMSTKREQIRTYQSPSIHQTLDDLIHQISPLKSKLIDYTELIHAMKLSLNQKTNLLDYIHHEENHVKHRMTNSQLKQQKLLQLIDKLLEQEKISEKYLRLPSLPKPEFEHHHAKQFIELNQLNDEYQLLQNENRQLKQNAKENIKTLYNFINQITE